MRPFRPRLAAASTVLAVTVASLTACSSAAPSGGAAPATTPPASVVLSTFQGKPGKYLTDAAGRALYMWENDPSGTSTCTGACAVAWPPLTYSGSVQAGAGVEAKEIGTTTRPDGTKQVTYNGWPLYYFQSDVSKGQITGEGNTGFGAVWWLLRPDGSPLAAEPVQPSVTG